MAACPKCKTGLLVDEVHEDRCINCGNRIQKTRPALTASRPDLEEAEEDHRQARVRAPRPAAIRPVRNPRTEPAKERTPTMAIGKTCTNPRCEDDAAENSVYCPKHRDQKKRANDRQRLKLTGRPIAAKPQTARPPKAPPRPADPVAAASSDGPAAPAQASTLTPISLNGKTVRQITIEEIDNVIAHLQQTRAMMVAFPVL